MVLGQFLDNFLGKLVSCLFTSISCLFIYSKILIFQVQFFKPKKYLWTQKLEFWFHKIVPKIVLKKNLKHFSITNFCLFFFRWSRRIKMKIWLYLQHRKSHSIKEKKYLPPPLKKLHCCKLSFFSPQTKNEMEVFERLLKNYWQW